MTRPLNRRRAPGRAMMALPVGHAQPQNGSVFSNDVKRALLFCLLTTLIGVGMLVWSTTVEAQFQLIVFGAGLLALLVGAVSAIGIIVAMLWEG
jgi:hypothetical protein